MITALIVAAISLGAFALIYAGHVALTAIEVRRDLRRTAAMEQHGRDAVLVAYDLSDGGA